MKTFFYRPDPLHWRLTPLTGPDARDFLHRLTTVDVKHLAPGRGALGFFLNPLGKIQAQFVLWCFGPEDFGFEYADTAEGLWQNQLLATIDRYTFAEKLFIGRTQPSPDESSPDSAKLECIWLLGDSSGTDDLRAFSTASIEEQIRLSDHGAQDFGMRWITAWGRPSQLRTWSEQLGAQAITLTELHRRRVTQGRPWIESELILDSNPLELGLVDGIAENKGCYPGQEVIERIISLGAPARRLGRIDFSQPHSFNLPQKVWSTAQPPVEVGELTSLGELCALGLVRKIYAKPGLDVTMRASDISDATPGKLAWIAPFANPTAETPEDTSST